MNFIKPRPYKPEEWEVRIAALEAERDALELALDKLGDGIYCPACGSCGIMDCCSEPKCLHREANQKQFTELLTDCKQDAARADAAESMLITVTAERDELKLELDDHKLMVSGRDLHIATLEAAERGPCIPDEQYQLACNLATSTHTTTDGVERCDLCGCPAPKPHDEQLTLREMDWLIDRAIEQRLNDSSERNRIVSKLQSMRAAALPPTVPAKEQP